MSLRVQAQPEGPFDVALTVYEADRVVARALLELPDTLCALTCEPGVDPHFVATALLTHLAPAAIATWRADDPLEHAAAELGYAPWFRKVYVTRDLTDLPAPGAVRLTPLEQVGAAAFDALLRQALSGTPAPDLPDPSCALEELRTWEGPTHDPSAWCAAELAGEAVGVVLGNRFPDGTGSFTFLGLVPAARGRGLGRALYAAGLHLLAQRGARRLLCATTPDNRPMLSVYAKSGCQLHGVRRFRRRPQQAG